MGGTTLERLAEEKNHALEGQARPSAEAMGIDVIMTAEKAGLPFSLNSTREVVYTGLLLLD